MMQILPLTLLICATRLDLGFAAKSSRCSNFSETIETVDRCVFRFFMQDRLRWFPTKMDDFEAFCAEKRADLQCVKNYIQCADRTVREDILTLVVATSTRAVDNLCNNAEQRSLFLQNLKCNNRERLEPLDICADKAVLAIKELKASNSSDHLQGLCCSIQLFKNCLYEAAQSACDDTAADDFYEYSIRFLMNTLSVIEIECNSPDVASTSVCRPRNRELTKIFALPHVEPQKKSIVMDVIELIARHFQSGEEER